eukprot:EG_transcript_19351
MAPVTGSPAATFSPARRARRDGPFRGAGLLCLGASVALLLARWWQSRRASAPLVPAVTMAALFGTASPPAATRLLQLVSTPTPDPAAVLDCIAALEAARAAVDGRALEGPWEVAWSDGSMAWRALVARAVQVVSGRSRAGQSFDLRKGTALNFAELLDSRVRVTATGTFRPTAGALPGRYPAAFDVQIRSGELGAAGRSFALPISGPGVFECLYGDDRVRVFRSPAGLAVQVRSDWSPSP